MVTVKGVTTRSTISCLRRGNTLKHYCYLGFARIRKEGYGRVAYQMMENYWPIAGDKPTATKHEMEHSKWYAKVHKVVLSKTMKDGVLTSTEIISDKLSGRKPIELNSGTLRRNLINLKGDEIRPMYCTVKYTMLPLVGTGCLI